MGVVMMTTVMASRAADVRSHRGRTIPHPCSTVNPMPRAYMISGMGRLGASAGRARTGALALAICFTACLLGSAAPILAQGEDAASAARGALDEYIRAWNDEDNDAIAAITNFPRISIGLNGQIVVRDNPEEIVVDFDLLRAAEGWDHTTLDLVDATQVSPDKVHFRVVTSRRRADGSPYRTTPALYVVTNQDGQWGLQVQSVLPPTFSAR